MKKVITFLVLLFLIGSMFAQAPVKRNSGNNTSTSQTNKKIPPKRNVTPPPAYNHDVINLKGVTYKMIFVAGGTFTMGATSEMKNPWDDEKPAHQVTVSSFFIGQTEVTQALWKAVMDNNPSRFKGDDRPVECVSWNDCMNFISKLNNLTGKNYRLPTEAEWEFAARGGNKSNHTQYSGSSNVGDVAWYSDNSGHETHPVAKKKANELGIYDMCGNVWEWCSDYWGDYSGGDQANPKGPNTGAYCVSRGGGWSHDARFCRSSTRVNYARGGNYNTQGLRLCLSK